MSLFELASTYSGFGSHRTGSNTQLAAEAWLSEYLNSIANQVEYFDFNYLHFDAVSELNQNGREVASTPLYYESINELVHCENVEVVRVDNMFEEHRAYQDIQSMVQRAQAKQADALVVATACETDSLYALNVSPELKNSLPVILVPGSEYQNISRGDLTLNYSASVDQRQARNLVARFGAKSSSTKIVVTTPISGWFECAGERGTGVALAIALAEYLSSFCAVELVLASGHELGYLGGFKYTESLVQPPDAMIHLGSSMAAVNTTLEAWSNIESGEFDDLDNKLQQNNITLNRVNNPSRPSDWVGEAECWSRFNIPKLSIAGGHPQFHTPEDRVALSIKNEELTKTFELLVELVTIVEKSLN